MVPPDFCVCTVNNRRAGVLPPPLGRFIVGGGDRAPALRCPLHGKKLSCGLGRDDKVF